MFDLQELLERGDLRADLIKDLERLGQRLSHWASLPDVDLEQIQRMQQESTQLSRNLLNSPRPGARLKRIACSAPFVSASPFRVVCAPSMCRNCTTGWRPRPSPATSRCSNG